MKPSTKRNSKQGAPEQDIIQPEQKKTQPGDIIHQKPKSQTMIDRVGEMYNAAKIQENENYIGIKQKNDEFEKENQEKKIRKKKKYAKKVDLFSDDSHQSDRQKAKKQNEQKLLKNQKPEDDRQNSDQQSNQPPPHPKQKQKHRQKVKHQEQTNKKNPVVFDQDENRIQSPNSCEQEEKDREQKMKQMLEENAKKNNQGDKQLSFSVLIQKAGNDKQKIKRLVYQAIPEGYRAICTFRRISIGFTQIFQLVLQDQQRCIFYCQNQRGSIGANYYISLTKQMDKKSQSYLGKLRGNPTGSIYHLYDRGQKTEKKSNRKDWKITMAKIQYQTNFMGINGPRKIKVVTPKVCSLEQLDTYKLSDTEDIGLFQPPIVIKYRNKQPKWNERLKSYALNFGGRVKQASIKNFLLMVDDVPIEKQIQMTNVLIFGKIDENSFSLEAIHPLSLYQAFAIVVSQFDFKLNCE